MSDDKKKFIIFGSKESNDSDILSIFNGEESESLEYGCDFVIANDLDEIPEELDSEVVLLRNEPGNIQEFIKKKGEVFIEVSLLKNPLAKKMLSNYSKSKKGIYQNFTLDNLLEYQNTFKVLDFTRLGFYADIIHLEAHESSFHPVKIRTFLDLTLLFFNYLTQEGKAGFPVELDLGRTDSSFILSASIRCESIDKEAFLKMFNPVKERSNESSLLSLVCATTDLLDIQVYKTSIKITGIWEKNLRKKQSSLIFNFNLESKMEDVDASADNSFNPEILSFDKEKHYERLSGVRGKDLPYEEGDVLNYGVMKISAKFLRELALYACKTLKPQFLKDLDAEGLKHVLEGFPDVTKVKNLNQDHYENILKIIKQMNSPENLIQKNNGNLDPETYQNSIAETTKDDFISKVKNYIENEDSYHIAQSAIVPEIDNLIGTISGELNEEGKIQISGKLEILEPLIAKSLNLNITEGESHWLVKSLSQYLSSEENTDGVSASDLQTKINQFLSEMSNSPEHNSVKNIIPKLEEVTQNWEVKNLEEIKQEVINIIHDEASVSGVEGDKAIAALSDLLLSEDDNVSGDELLLRAQIEKLNREKEFYKRANDDTKKQILDFKKEIEKLRDDNRRKDIALGKEAEFSRLQKEAPEEIEIDNKKYDDFESDAMSGINEGEQKKMRLILEKAINLNKDLMRAERLIRQMETESKRKQIFYNKEIDKALKKAQTAQNIADKAKAGLIRVSNTNQNEIKALKKNLDKVQNDMMSLNAKNMTRIKNLEKENHTLNSSNNNIQTKFDVIHSKYEKLLKDGESAVATENSLNNEKTRVIEEKYHKTEGQLQQALTLGQALHAKLKSQEFHEQKNMERIKELEQAVTTLSNNEKQLFEATGKKINPETGEIEGGGEVGQVYVEKRDKLIAANNKVLDLKKRLHVVERDRDNFMRKLKTLEISGGNRTNSSSSNTVPKAQHDRLEESFKVIGEDFKKVATQLADSRKEVNDLKTEVRTIDAEKQKIEEELAKLKKRNAA